MPRLAEPHRPADGDIGCGVVEATLEAFVDGEVSRREARRVELHVERCRVCAEHLALARRVRAELRQLPLPPCPEEVSRRVLAIADEPPWWRRLVGTGALRPALALLALAIAVAVWRADDGALRRPPAADSPPVITQAEVAQAEREVKLAFAYLGEIGRRAGANVGTEVGDRVVRPISRSLGLRPPVVEDRDDS